MNPTTRPLLLSHNPDGRAVYTSESESPEKPRSLVLGVATMLPRRRPGRAQAGHPRSRASNMAGGIFAGWQPSYIAGEPSFSERARSAEKNEAQGLRQIGRTSIFSANSLHRASRKGGAASIQQLFFVAIVLKVCYGDFHCKLVNNWGAGNDCSSKSRFGFLPRST